MADARSFGALRPEDQKQALLAAAQAAVQDAHDKATRRPGQTSSTSRIVVTVLGLAIFAVGIYILAMRPAWFFTPPPPSETVEIQEASLRLMLVREASRIRQYQAAHGRLPATLVEAGSRAGPNVDYLMQGDSAFRLVTSWGAQTIGLSSTDSVGPFLGNSLKVIASRGRP